MNTRTSARRAADKHARVEHRKLHSYDADGHHLKPHAAGYDGRGNFREARERTNWAVRVEPGFLPDFDTFLDLFERFDETGEPQVYDLNAWLRDPRLAAA